MSSAPTQLTSKAFVSWLILFEVFTLTASCTTMRPAPAFERERPPRYSRYVPEDENKGKYRDPYWYRERKLKNKPAVDVESAPSQHPTDGTLHESSSGFQSNQAPDFDLFDDMDSASLIKAINNQLESLYIQDPTQVLRFGNTAVSRLELVESLESFLAILHENLPADEFMRRIRNEFRMIKAGGNNKEFLVTGYYTPVMQASRTRIGPYQYPIYKLPEDASQTSSSGQLTNVSWNDSSQSSAQVVRQLTRRDIDGTQALANKNLEIAWLKDDLDRYFLHIQGSGILQFRDGTMAQALFQAANNYTYNGIGKMMIESGAIEVSQGSMQGIKQYFREHPEDIPKYLYNNNRYIFFNLSQGNPRGSGGAEVVGGRSIATDKSIYPAGGLAFIRLRKPILDENNNIERWEPFSRFVVDQDTGSAIRGPARADLYFGAGDQAGAKAGRFHERGEVYYLLKKSVQ